MTDASLRSANRIHVTGGPGSGKTTLARRIASLRDAPHFELDAMALDLESRMPAREAFALLARELPAIIERPAWVTDGAYLGWARPLLDAADQVVWTDTTARVALYRVVARHVKAELAGNNRFRGWRRLYRFWRWCAGYYTNRNPDQNNVFGVPETRALAEKQLDGYRGKIVVCRNNAGIERLMHDLGA